MKHPRRCLLITLLVLCLLLAANVCVALAHHNGSPSLELDAAQIVRLELYRVDHERRTDRYAPADPQQKRIISDPEELTIWCELFSDLFLREFPYWRLSGEEKEWTNLLVNGEVFRFVHADGRVTEIVAGSNMARIGSHWYYASCGESRGYQPLFFTIFRDKCIYPCFSARPIRDSESG